MKTKLRFKRYPTTSNRSLRAWSAADEYLLDQLNGYDLKDKKIVLVNDRFGYLMCNLIEHSPYFVSGFKSQEKSLQLNCELNGIELDAEKLLSPLNPLPSDMDLALLKVPKSTPLFEFQLQQIASVLSSDGIVLAGFMTRHFNKKLIEIAELYFDSVEQGLAWKKSRVLTLKKPKTVEFEPALKKIRFEHPKTGAISLKQYPGVFSSARIDPATLFLIDHLKVSGSEQKILDLASGNGILAIAASTLSPEAEIHLMDDSFLAIESSKLNLESEKVRFHYSDSIGDLDQKDFDLVISNPPFHFGHETNIEVSLKLFEQVLQALKPGGKFTLVANKHLNYKTHLAPLFRQVNILAENRKFIIYECLK